MKWFIVKVLIFFILVFAFDLLFGQACNFLNSHAIGGDTKRHYYVCNETKESVLVFGSSRAHHHYNPAIISDSLGVSCFNCGQEGAGAILNYGRSLLISERYKPQLIIYDVIPIYDLLLEEDNHKYLGLLKPYYHCYGIPEIFESVDKTEKYKMLSNMYRYNTRFIQMVSDNIHPMGETDFKGYCPFNEEMDTLKISRTKVEKKEYNYDQIKIEYFRNITDVFNETRLIFVVSPFWNGVDSTVFQPVKSLCNEKSIDFIDFSNCPKYVHHNEYFKDGFHLNSTGADEFTKDLMSEIKRRKLLN